MPEFFQSAVSGVRLPKFKPHQLKLGKPFNTFMSQFPSLYRASQPLSRVGLVRILWQMHTNHFATVTGTVDVLST